MSTTPTEHGARWRASLLAKAIEIAGTATDTPDSRTLVAMFDDELEAFAGYVLDASGRVDAGYRHGWEDVRDALGLRGNLPVSNAQYHASVLMPKLREVIRAATPVPVESLGRVPRAEHSPPRAVPDLSKSWPERDYMCVCSQCGDTFIGWKRQAVCRGCTPPEPAPSAPAEGCGACGDACNGGPCRLAQESPPTASADVEALDWITDDMSGIQIVDQVRILAKFSRIEDDEIVKALEIALDRLRLSAPAAVKDCLTTADVEALARKTCASFGGNFHDRAKDTWTSGRAGLYEFARRLSGAQQADPVEYLPAIATDIPAPAAPEPIADEEA